MSPLITTRAGASANAYGWGAASAAASTGFESIATFTGTGATQAVTFSSISQSFKHLQIRCVISTTTVGQSPELTFNGDTASNYNRAYIRASASSLTSFNGATSFAANLFPNGTKGTNFSSIAIIDIYDYTNANKNKTVKNFNFNQTQSPASSMLVYESGLWRNNAAITSLSFSSLNYTSETVIGLYGIGG